MTENDTQICDLDEAYRLVIDAIVNEKLAPNQKVSEYIFSDVFGISRAVSRNLIERLITNHFLISVSERVTQVAPLTLLEIKQNFTLRKIILPEILTLAATNVDFEELYSLNEKIRNMLPVTDSESALEALNINRLLNLAMCKKSRYLLMLDWLRQLEDMAMRIYWLYVTIDQSFPYSNDQQDTIFDLMISNGPVEVRQATQGMLMQTEERVLNAFCSRPPFHKQDLII